MNRIKITKSLYKKFIFLLIFNRISPYYGLVSDIYILPMKL